MMNQKQQATRSGFRQTGVNNKQALVRTVFDGVAERYDVMNDLMSAGLHRMWKHRLIEALYLRPRSSTPLRFIDVAGGTGDIAFRAHARAQKLGSTLNIQVIDANEKMVRVGARRSRKNGQTDIDFLIGTAEALPLADGSVDYLTMAFGIRNVTHRDRALTEIYRVLQPGGRFVCLEFSQLPSRLVQKAYDTYACTLIPPLGRLVTGDSTPYHYLVDSIRQFPCAEDFAAEIRAAGLVRVGFQRLSNGIAALHTGWRI